MLALRTPGSQSPLKLVASLTSPCTDTMAAALAMIGLRCAAGTGPRREMYHVQETQAHGGGAKVEAGDWRHWTTWGGGASFSRKKCAACQWPGCGSCS